MPKSTLLKARHALAGMERERSATWSAARPRRDGTRGPGAGASPGLHAKEARDEMERKRDAPQRWKARTTTRRPSISGAEGRARPRRDGKRQCLTTAGREGPRRKLIHAPHGFPDQRHRSPQHRPEALGRGAPLPTAPPSTLHPQRSFDDPHQARVQLPRRGPRRHQETATMAAVQRGAQVRARAHRHGLPLFREGMESAQIREGIERSDRRLAPQGARVTPLVRHSSITQRNCSTDSRRMRPKTSGLS